MDSRNNLPQVVIHALSAHGPVEVTTIGNGMTSRLPCAPFENVVYLFVVPSSSTEAGLLQHSGVLLSAKASDGAYTIRLTGRAHAGMPLGSHRERSQLEPWAPEGIPTSRILVVPFEAEEMEYVHGRDDKVERYSGRTPIGIRRVGATREYGRAALSGLALPMSIWTSLAALFWLVVQGVHYGGREIAAALSLVGGVGMITGFRLIYVSCAFTQWRKGRARREDAPVLSEGLIAPAQARKMAAFLLGFSALAFISLAMLWGSEIVGLLLGVSGIWLIGPAWALHLLMRQPEASR